MKLVMLPVNKLTLEYALRRRRYLEREVKRREETLSRRYPVFRLWLVVNNFPHLKSQVDGDEIMAAAENSGAFKSLEWFAMYLAIARREVWGEVASMLCEQEHGNHEFIATTPLNSDHANQICKYCGLEWV